MRVNCKCNICHTLSMLMWQGSFAIQKKSKKNITHFFLQWLGSLTIGEDSDGMDMWNTPMVQSRQPMTYRLNGKRGPGRPKMTHGNSWQRGIAESGISRPSTLLIDISGDLVWDLPCVQQASYLEGGPLVWMLPLYLHINQKSDYDDDMNNNLQGLSSGR